jgi:signal transduction histidine kinase
MRARSIHLQLALTLIIAVAIVLGVHALVVIKAPPPPPQLQSVQQMALALGDATRAATFGLSSEAVPQLPAGMESNLVSDTLAQILRVEPDRVRMRWSDGQRSLSIRQIGPNPAANDVRISQALLLVPALPPFAAALREPNGARWQLVTPVQPWLSAWQQQILASFVLSALLLVPLAWWAASRLSQPLRQLGQAAKQLDLSSDPTQIPLNGPLEAQQLGHALRAAMQRWQQQSAERVQLIAAIAHDLRTPLTGLRLRLDPLPDAEREPLLADLGRIEQMMTRALEYVHSDQDALEMEPVVLPLLAQDGVSSAQAAGLAVRWLGAADCEIPLRADALALHRALANLIENAARHGGGGEVSVRVEGGFAGIEVSDHGPGIASDRIEQLLQPFQRGDRARSTRGGFGLGLSIAATIARRHGGALRLAARTGGGLVAGLWLPLDPSAQRELPG